MEHPRVHRVGNRTYYRNNYVQSPNSRPTIEERLHAQGISTSSNSSWTFSNSHSDLPKKRKGRLCGLFLIAAVFVVLLAVLAIGGLAFYLGAVRADNSKQELVFDGSLRVTYGDQYQAVLGNRSSRAFREKALRYSNMLTNVYQRSIVAPAFEDVNILRFENGSLIVHFRMMLDRRKLPHSVASVEEILKSILVEEISSVKPIAFRNLQVDHQNLHIKRYLGDPLAVEEQSSRKLTRYESEKNEAPTVRSTEVKNGVVRKTSSADTSQEGKTGTKPQQQPQNKTLPIPEGAIIGISEKMQNFSDTLKKRQEESSSKATTTTTTTTTPSTTAMTVTEETIKSVEFSKEVEFVNGSDAGPQMEFDGSVEQSTNVTSGSSESDAVATMNGHARPPFEVVLEEPTLYGPPRIPASSEFIVPDYDEPWRPIISPPRKPPIVREPEADVYDDMVVAEPPPRGDGPITFSRESYEENLRISPEYGGEDGKLSKITEEIAKKYEEFLKSQKVPGEVDFDGSHGDVTVDVEDVKKDIASSEAPLDMPLGLDQIISGISLVGSHVDEMTEETGKSSEEMTTAVEEVEKAAQEVNATTEMVKTTEAVKIAEREDPGNDTAKDPFTNGEDFRSSSAFSFDLPDFPILKQFHHLDSLLKSFSPEESGLRGGYPNETTTTTTAAATRFPVRTRPTTERVFVAVSTVAPETTTARTRPDTFKTPIVIKGEVQVLDSKNLRSGSATTEPPKLITLLPVRSNVRGPLRPRPKLVVSGPENRKPKMSSEFKRTGSASAPRVLYSIPQKYHFVDDKDGKRWVYYSSSKVVTTTAGPEETEKLFIVTPESEKPSTTEQEEPEGREENVVEEGKSTAAAAAANTSDLINRIVNIMENVVISTGNSTKVILKVNQTIINGTDGTGKINETMLTDPKFVISTKAVSSHYKLNQAGVPILTKILNKAPNYYKRDKNDTTEVQEEEEVVDVDVTTVPTTTPIGSAEDSLQACENGTVACGNGTCLPMTSRCNQQVDCPDAADEKNCTCADHLRSQHLNRKLCDGIVDCWDFSDEFGCEWCKGKDYLCSNSKMCINKSQICDGANNCPLGDDERYCVTVSPNEREANSFNYHPNGYLMVRKHGEWGKLCIDNFDAVSAKSKTGWKISDLGRSVCKALTFKDFDKVERMISVPNEGRSLESSGVERYYELSYNDVSGLEESSSTRDSALSFHETQCTKKEVVKVTCTELECGLRPQAMNQWSRIVGGGNANPGSWPWQAALYKEGEFQCGATLISGQWLVSAGHCFYHNQEEYWVARLGTLRTTSSLPSPYEQLRQISKIILHPHYVDTGFINDISLLKLADPVTFTDYVRPICLPKPNAKIIDGTMCTVVGWGQLFEIGRIFPDTLQEVQLPIISSTECRKRTVFLPLYKITDDMFCAGYDRGGRDACLGDSGGPLMCQESDGKWSLYGVTSNGYGCARSNRPGVYTKVSKYLNWLQSQMHLHSEDEILSQSSLKQLSASGQDDSSASASTLAGNHSDSDADAIIKLISERVSNVKLSTGPVKRRDRCKGHRCPLGECLSKSRLCNGIIECSDGSDEKDCW